jgi:hypothetical protein
MNLEDRSRPGEGGSETIPAKVVDHSLPTADDIATACEAFAVLVVTPTGHYRRRLFLSLHSATAAVQRRQMGSACRR